jgi:predicted restriction endonuclease
MTRTRIWSNTPNETLAKFLATRQINTPKRYLKYITLWKQGLKSGTTGKKLVLSSYVKRYLNEKYHSQCAKCGWHEINQIIGRSPLEVHHIDGNRLNHSENNLILLCPNCHSLTESWCKIKPK